MTRIKKLYKLGLIIMASLFITLFPLNLLCQAQSLTEVREDFEDDLMLFGYVTICLASTTIDKDTIKTRYLNDFSDKYLKSKYGKYKGIDIPGLTDKTIELKIQDGSRNALTSSLLGCKHNINEMIKLFNNVGISAPYLHKALQSF